MADASNAKDAVEKMMAGIDPSVLTAVRKELRQLYAASFTKEGSLALCGVIPPLAVRHSVSSLLNSRTLQSLSNPLSLSLSLSLSTLSSVSPLSLSASLSLSLHLSLSPPLSLSTSLSLSHWILFHPLVAGLAYCVERSGVPVCAKKIHQVVLHSDLKRVSPSVLPKDLSKMSIEQHVRTPFGVCVCMYVCVCVVWCISMRLVWFARCFVLSIPSFSLLSLFLFPTLFTHIHSLLLSNSRTYAVGGWPCAGTDTPHSERRTTVVVSDRCCRSLTAYSCV
jgi:hypothetical protein